jgi:hypothetical protein
VVLQVLTSLVGRLGRNVTLLIGAALIALVAIVLLTRSSGDGPIVKPVAAERPIGPPSASFALLRQPSKVQMPDDVQKLLSNEGAPVSSAKAVDLGFDRPGWVLSSDTTVCIVVPDTLNGKFAGYGSSCRPSSDAQLGGVSDTRYASEAEMKPGGTRQVFAVIPDGVSALTVTDANGSTTKVPVQGNVAQFKNSVSFTTDAGLQTLVAADAPSTTSIVGK